MGILSAIESALSDPLAALRTIWAAKPLLEDLAVGGPAAVAAFQQKAPDAWKHAQELAATWKREYGGSSAAPSDEETAAVAAHVAGVDPPGWTSEETRRWMDRASELSG